MEHLARDRLPVALAFLGSIGFARLGGGFTQVSWGGVAAWFCLVALVVILRGDAQPLARLELVSVGAFLVFVAWTAASLLWTGSVSLTALDVERSLWPVGVLFAALLVTGADSARLLAVGVGAASVVLAGWALIAGVDEPIGYANALGLLCVMGLLLALGWTAQRRDGVALATTVPAASVLLVVLSRTQSRGAVVAFIGGAAVALALRSRRPLATTLAALAVAVIGVAALAAVGSSERAAYWSVTFHEIGREPVLGSGAGTWQQVWLQHRHVDSVATNAHSLYLEVLSELGAVGLVILLTALVAPILAAVQARSRTATPPIAAAYAAFLIHLGVDWDWQITPVAVAGVLLGAALLGSAREGSQELWRPPRRWALASAAALAAMAVTVWSGGWLDNSAQEQLRSGRWALAEHSARRAHLLQPWSADPWRLLGEAQLAQADQNGAADSFRRGLGLDPGDAQLWRLLVKVSSGGELLHACERLRRLDPRGTGPD